MDATPSARGWATKVGLPTLRLLRAVCADDLGEFREALMHGADVNAVQRDVNGATVLHIAAARRTPDFLMSLLPRGPSLGVDRLRQTALHMAAKHTASPLSVPLLVSNYGVDDSVDYEGNTFLHAMMLNREMPFSSVCQVVDWVLREGGDRFLNRMNHRNMTVLDVAVMARNAENEGRLHEILMSFGARRGSEVTVGALDNLIKAERESRRRIIVRWEKSMDGMNEELALKLRQASICDLVEQHIFNLLDVEQKHREKIFAEFTKENKQLQDFVQRDLSTGWRMYRNIQEDKRITILQRLWRIRMNLRRHERQQNAAIRVQSWVRGVLTRRQVDTKELRRAVRIIQRIGRAFICRSMSIVVKKTVFLKQRRASIVILYAYRRYQSNKRLASKLKEQMQFVRVWVSDAHLEFSGNILFLQLWGRHIAQRIRERRLQACVTQIQTFFRHAHSSWIVYVRSHVAEAADTIAALLRRRRALYLAQAFVSAKHQRNCEHQVYLTTRRLGSLLVNEAFVSGLARSMPRRAHLPCALPVWVDHTLRIAAAVALTVAVAVPPWAPSALRPLCIVAAAVVPVADVALGIPRGWAWRAAYPAALTAAAVVALAVGADVHAMVVVLALAALPLGEECCVRVLGVLPLLVAVVLPCAYITAQRRRFEESVVHSLWWLVADGGEPLQGRTVERYVVSLAVLGLVAWICAVFLCEPPRLEEPEDAPCEVTVAIPRESCRFCRASLARYARREVVRASYGRFSTIFTLVALTLSISLPSLFVMEIVLSGLLFFEMVVFYIACPTVERRSCLVRCLIARGISILVGLIPYTVPFASLRAVLLFDVVVHWKSLVNSQLAIAAWALILCGGVGVSAIACSGRSSFAGRWIVTFFVPWLTPSIVDSSIDSAASILSLVIWRFVLAPIILALFARASWTGSPQLEAYEGAFRSLQRSRLPLDRLMSMWLEGNAWFDARKAVVPFSASIACKTHCWLSRARWRIRRLRRPRPCPSVEQTPLTTHRNSGVMCIQTDSVSHWSRIVSCVAWTLTLASVAMCWGDALRPFLRFSLLPRAWVAYTAVSIVTHVASLVLLGLTRPTGWVARGMGVIGAASLVASIVARGIAEGAGVAWVGALIFASPLRMAALPGVRRCAAAVGDVAPPVVVAAALGAAIVAVVGAVRAQAATYAVATPTSNIVESLRRAQIIRNFLSSDVEKIFALYVYYGAPFVAALALVFTMHRKAGMAIPPTREMAAMWTHPYARPRWPVRLLRAGGSVVFTSLLIIPAVLRPSTELWGVEIALAAVALVDAMARLGWLMSRRTFQRGAFLVILALLETATCGFLMASIVLASLALSGVDVTTSTPIVVSLRCAMVARYAPESVVQGVWMLRGHVATAMALTAMEILCGASAIAAVEDPRNFAASLSSALRRVAEVASKTSVQNASALTLTVGWTVRICTAALWGYLAAKLIIFVKYEPHTDGARRLYEIFARGLPATLTIIGEQERCRAVVKHQREIFARIFEGPFLPSWSVKFLLEEAKVCAARQAHLRATIEALARTRQHLKGAEGAVNPLALVEAVFLVEQRLPCHVSEEATRWMDFVSHIRRNHAATVLQATWRMFAVCTTCVCPRAHAVSIAHLRAQVRTRQRKVRFQFFANETISSALRWDVYAPRDQSMSIALSLKSQLRSLFPNAP